MTDPPVPMTAVRVTLASTSDTDLLSARASGMRYAWAKHAVIVDHLVPPMARAESYGDIPRLAQTTGELDAFLHALDGRFIPAGPFGSPLRGLVNALPTGQNCYTVGPRAVPSRLAWQTSQAVAAGQRNIVVMRGGALDLDGLDDWFIWWGGELRHGSGRAGRRPRRRRPGRTVRRTRPRQGCRRLGDGRVPVAPGARMKAGR